MGNGMVSRVKKTAVTLCVTATAAMAVAAPAGAANQDQDGLVNVAIGDVTIEDVNVGVAANIVANVCGVKVGPVALLARQVDAGGAVDPVCDAAGGVTLSQN
jgi:hypothetical protein